MRFLGFFDLLFCGYLLVTFLSELATTFAVSHLSVSGDCQYYDRRSYHKGSHFGGLRTHILSYSGFCARSFSSELGK